MKAIARQGDTKVLVHTKGTIQSGEAVGHIVDLRREEVHDEQNVQSVLARGYWTGTVRADLKTKAETLVQEYLQR